MSYTIPTLTELLSWLRFELNDVLEDGNTSRTYTDDDLTHFLNRAKGEAELLTGAHKERVSITLATGTNTYSIAPVFEPVEASYDGTTLTVAQLAEMANTAQGWDAAATGTPTHLLHLSGSQVRVWPTPGTTAQPLVVHGFAVSAALAQSSDAVTSLPAGLATAVVLEGAKVFAYLARGNGALAGGAEQKFNVGCAKIVEAIKAGAL